MAPPPRARIVGTTKIIADKNVAKMLREQFAEAHYNLGLALHQQGEEAEAQTEFNKAYEISPELRNVPRP
jgi:tetratricopeptide (TPR) repeat protein